MRPTQENSNEYNQIQSLAKMLERVYFEWDSPWFGNNGTEDSYGTSVCVRLTLLKSVEFSRLFNCSSAASIKPCIAVTTVSKFLNNFTQARIRKK